MKQKILKLIKILNKFTIDDILSMDDFEEQEFDEEELRLQKERQRREQEQSQNRYA